MVKRILITRPRHDIATEYLYDFSKPIVKLLREKSDIRVTDLKDSQATRANLERNLDTSTGLVFLNGHGNNKCVAGHNNEVILDEKNIHLAEDKIVYALACNSLTDLGGKAVKRGVRTYIGYGAKFMIIRDPTRSGSPHRDKNARPFKKACSTLINSLAFGKNVRKSLELTKREYENAIKSYGTSEDDPFGDVPLIRFALTWDLEFLDAVGDLDASF